MSESSPSTASKLKILKGLSFVLTPALVAALAIAACTSSKTETAASKTESRNPASSEATKPVDDSLASFVASTNAGKTKSGKSWHSGKTSHHQTSSENVYVVQIGAFRIKANAEKLNDKLKGEGYPVVMQALDHSSNGQLYLVRLNPMADRREAETMRMNLKAKADIDSMILALPKEERAVSSESAPKVETKSGVHEASTDGHSEVH